MSTAALKEKLRPRQLRKDRAGGQPGEYPLRIAKVTEVDSIQRTFSLYILTGSGDTYDKMQMSFPGAGARHFLGAIPEVNDLCVVGFSPAESGSSAVPYVVGWLVPGASAGYDWLMTSPTKEDEVSLTPAMREALTGTFGRRRHKLRHLEAGNVGASSSQGSDLILDEGVLLANRRGNELLLRDQDQALVSRSLQRFHAGAGVRTYSGMVQRDSTLLPTQMFADDIDWTAGKQIESDGTAVAPGDLPETDNPGALTAHPVFETNLQMGNVDPNQALVRGLFIDEHGMMYDELVRPSATYGGKNLYRVSMDPNADGSYPNAALSEDAEVFTEVRWEVSHTADGTLPVTEQTDGIDIDRLLPNAPTEGTDGSGDVNPLNRSPNAPMVEVVMGTAIGNDPINERSSYGRPLVPALFDENGRFSPGLHAAGPTTPVSDHAAFLVRVHNPTDPKAPPAFMAITKGGAYRSYFPGSGSESHQEFYQTGKRIRVGRSAAGESYVLEGTGGVSVRGIGVGRSVDNIGVEMRAEESAVSIFGGAATTSGAASPTSDPNLTLAGNRYAVLIESAKSMLLSAVETLKISGQRVELDEIDTLRARANTSMEILSGDTIAVSSKKLNVTITGKAEFTYGGPLDSKPTNGPSRTTTFTATPLTGGTGGVVDRFDYVFGGRKSVFRVGRQDTVMNAGSFNVTTMAPAPITVGQGSGVHLSTGLPGLKNKLDLDVLGAALVAGAGSVKVQATKGSASLKGSVSAVVQGGISATIRASFVKVNTPTPFTGGVLTDGCLSPITGRSYALSGGLGVATFRVSN